MAIGQPYQAPPPFLNRNYGMPVTGGSLALPANVLQNVPGFYNDPYRHLGRTDQGGYQMQYQRDVPTPTWANGRITGTGMTPQEQYGYEAQARNDAAIQAQTPNFRGIPYNPSNLVPQNAAPPQLPARQLPGQYPGAPPVLGNGVFNQNAVTGSVMNGMTNWYPQMQPPRPQQTGYTLPAKPSPKPARK